MSTHNCKVGKTIPNSDLDFDEDIIDNSKDSEDSNDRTHIESLD